MFRRCWLVKLSSILSIYLAASTDGSTMIDIAALLIFPLAMTYAAFSDLFTMTISNWISLLLVVAYLVLAFAVGLSWQDMAWAFACGALVLVITFGMFCAGWMGGGDAKLAAASAIWLGWAHVMNYGLVASVFGAVLTLAIISIRRWPLPAFLTRYDWVLRLHDQREGIPYGIALALAGLYIYPQSQIWLATSNM